MSRFVAAQRTAFQKLLKKYKKWTSSSELDIRFRKEVLDRPTSFSKRDFEPLLAQWTEVLAAVRAPFSDGPNWQSRPAHSEGESAQPEAYVPKKLMNDAARQSNQGHTTEPNIVQSLQSIWEEGSNIDIDTALAIIALGRGATKAVYWVHPDNIVQVHILLLQYTRLHKSNDSISSPDWPSSSRSSPRTSFSNISGRPTPRTDDEIGLIVCDDLQRFAKRQSSETISTSEDSPGKSAEKAAASVRYASTGEAIVVVDTVSGLRDQSVDSTEKRSLIKAKMKRKVVRQLFNASRGGNVTNENINEVGHISKWFAEHREVQPLVRLQSRRTRFVGLKNNPTGCIWATIDKDVHMSSCTAESIATGEALTMINEKERNGLEIFPHAILEVRLEGDAHYDLVEALNTSHLVSLRKRLWPKVC